MKLLRVITFVPLLLAFLIISPAVYAATAPALGTAAGFGILSSTYTNTTAGTIINGDLGYTTGPATAATVSGNIHAADGTYNQAGIDQGTALSSLNSQACTFTFASGAIDLSTDTTHGATGVYTPGVYCLSGASNAVVGGTITLNGAGTYIFRMNGALTTGANSIVALTGGASACNVWWTPTAATTLGANSTFVGTDIGPSGITIGSTITWSGRALAFGGTVSTTADTINVPTGCTTTTTGGGTTTSTTAAATSSSNSTPKLPDTGLAPKAMSNHFAWIGVSASVLVVASVFYFVRKKAWPPWLNTA